MDLEQKAFERLSEKQKKAQAMRYRKSLLLELNYDTILNNLSEMCEFCDNIRYWIEGDEDTLINALDGDEDEAYEFKMLFSDLSAKCDDLMNVIYDNYITEYFNDFFVGIMNGGNGFFTAIGYDTFEEDYFNLSTYESQLASTESGKRIKRLTKDEIISISGQCFGLAMSYFDIKYKYDYLQAEFEFVKNENTSYLQAIKEIDNAYNSADEDGWIEYSDSFRQFDKLTSALPDRTWIE